MIDFTSYQEFGHGDPLILLPSNWLTSWSYKFIAQKLAVKYRVLIPDLFRGDSKFKKNAFTVKDYVQKFHSFVQERQITNFYLIGISFSGLIVSDYVLKYPKKIKRVFLVSTFIPFQRNRLTIIAGIIGYLKLFFHNTFSLKGIVVNLRWLYDALVNCLIKHPRQFFLDILIVSSKPDNEKKDISVPVKILKASHDEFINYKNFKDPKNHNLEIETISGFHTWFFLKEDILVEKIFKFFK